MQINNAVEAFQLQSLKRKRSDAEHIEQARLFKWADLMLPTFPELRWLHAIPNGGHRDIRTASKLKAEGVKAGVFDIFLPVPKDKWHGLYIEMKAGKNALTDLQQEFRKFIHGQGFCYRVCYSWGEAADAISAYLNPLIHCIKQQAERG